VPGAFADAERYGALAEADAALRPWAPTRPRRSARRRPAARSGSLCGERPHRSGRRAT